MNKHDVTMIQKVDNLDVRILRELQKDAHKSFQDLALKLKVTKVTIYNRIKKLQDMGVIRGYFTDIDFAKLGYELVVVIGIAVSSDNYSDIEKEIAKDKHVSAIYDVTGDFEAIIIANFKNREELNDFIVKLNKFKEIKKTYTMLVLNTVKNIKGVEL